MDAKAIIRAMKMVNLNQAKVARILKRKSRQEVWGAIHTDLYPILKERIINLIRTREAKEKSLFIKRFDKLENKKQVY